MADDYAGDSSTTGVVVFGKDFWGVLDTDKDTDWFRIDMTAGMTYDLSVLGGYKYGTVSNPEMRLLDDSGSVLLAGNSIRVFNNATYKSTVDQTVYLEIFAGGSNNTGIYTAHVSETVTPTPPPVVLTDDYADDFTTTTTLTVGTDLYGELETSTDIDMFSVDLTAGNTLTLSNVTSSSVTYRTGDADITYFRIFDDTGNELDAGSSLNYVVPATGQYFVSIGLDPTDPNTAPGTYFLRSVDIPPDAYTNDTSTTGAIAVDGTANGFFQDQNDEDWFAVTLNAGSTYELQIKGAASGDGTAAGAPTLEIYDDTGTALTTYGLQGGGYLKNVSYEYTAPYSGTYYLDAIYGGVGTYEIGVTDVTSGKPDDIGNTSGTAASLALDAYGYGRLEDVSDVDWFAIDLTAGQAFNAFVNSTSIQGRKVFLSFVPVVELLDDTGAVVATGVDAFTYVGRSISYGMDFDYVATTTGTYYLSVATNSTSFNRGSAGYYSVTYSDLVDLEGSTPATAVVLNSSKVFSNSFGKMADGTLQTSADADWYAIDLEAGSVYDFSPQFFTSYAELAAMQAYVAVYDSTGTQVSVSAEDTSDTERPVATLAPQTSGTYYISVEANGTLVNQNYALYSPPNSDLGASLDTSSTAFVGSGNINTATAEAINFAGDRDWYRLYLEKGDTIDVGMHGSETFALALDQPVLRILDADGVTLAVDYDPSQKEGASIPAFTAPYTGLYFVEAESLDPTATGTYAVHFVKGASKSTDIAADVSTTELLDYATGSKSVALRSVWDSDWYSVTLGAGESYTFDLDNLKLRTSASGDGAALKLVTASGEVLRYEDDAGINNAAQIKITGPTSGQYFVVVEDDDGIYSAGDLTFSKTSSRTDDYAGDSGASVAQMSLGTPINGAVEFADDEDWFEIDLAVGNLYRFDLKGSGSGALADPHLTIRDSNGAIVVQDFDSGSGQNAALVFTPETTGTYYVTAGAEDSGQGSYTLTGKTLSWNAGWTTESGQATEFISAPIAGFTSGSTALQSAWQLHYMPASGYTYYATEFAGALGADVLAGADGEVVAIRDTIADGTILSDPDLNIINVGETYSRTDTSPDGLGNYVTIKTKDGLYVTYAHLDGGSLSGIKTGDQVSRTDVLGQIGTTGWASSNTANFYAVQVILGTALIAGTGIADGKTDGSNGYAFIDDSGLMIDATQTTGSSAGPDTASYDAAALGTAQDDALSGFSGKTLFAGGDGDDLVYLAIGGNVVDGGTGRDFVDLGYENAGVVADLTAGTIAAGSKVDAITAVEGILATQSDDDIMLGGDAHIAIGRNGDDTITGNADGELISGGGGNDLIDAGAGGDWVQDNFGDDTISGGDGDDLVYALAGNNEINGDADDDVVVGGIGNDLLKGGTGNDIILGDPSGFFFGRDTIDGGSGDDLLFGGGGADQFVFRINGGDDTIALVDADLSDPTQVSAIDYDFVSGLDQVKLVGFGYADGAEALSHVSSSGGHAVFSDQGTSITFYGLAVADLSSDDFLV